MLRFRLLCFLLTTQLCSGAIKRGAPIFGEPLAPEERVLSRSARNRAIDHRFLDDIIQPTGRAGARPIVKWPNAVMPYVMDENFTKDEQKWIQEAIDLIQKNTCFKIIPHTGESNYTVLVKQYYEDNPCDSYVGMQGGGQEINIPPWCFVPIGGIAHELMHAMGFYHEQNRKNRNDYVTINFENMYSRDRRSYNQDYGDNGNIHAPYDLLSIMHYPRNASSENMGDTITPLKDRGEEFGKDEELTSLDEAKINIYYDCKNFRPSPEDNNLTKERTCRDVGRDCWELAQDSNNYCNIRRKYMAVYCKKTCKLCDLACEDFHESCAEWRWRNYCRKYPVYMKVYCPKSCGLC